MSLSNAHVAGRSIRAVLAAAVGSVGFAMAGCSDQSNGHADSAPPMGAVQASDAQRAQAPSDQTVSMAFPTGDRASSDLLIEENVPREARVGQPYRYQLKVTNLRPMTLRNVVLEQRIPDNVKVSAPSDASASPEGDRDRDRDQSHDGRMERINVGQLDPHQSKTIEMTGTPSQVGSIDTCLSARYSPPTLCTMVNVVAPKLAITAEGSSQSDICQEIVYKYTVTNTGTGTAHNVQVQENLPQGLQTVDGQQTIAASVGDLLAGQSKSVTVRLKASQAGNFTTQAAARSDDAGNAQAQQVAMAVLAPRLAVTVAGPKEDYLGDELTYGVTVKNEGTAAADHATVRIGATPDSVQFIGARNTDGSSISREMPHTGQDLGNLAPGDSRSVSITFRALKEGHLTLDATAEARCAQPVTTPVETDIRTITASALVVTHDPDPVRVGNDVIYHISVQNKGSATDHNVKVTATLPGSEQFVKGNGGTAVDAAGNNVTFGVIPDLAPKQVVNWDVEAKALQPADADVHVSMTSDSTKTPAEKIEPTKLFGDDTTNQQRTNEAQPVPTTSAPLPPAPNK